MTELASELYRTNKSIVRACSDLGIEFDPEDLLDLEQCTHCNIWWHGFELLLDLDFNNICRFCEERYGR
jgi:hypothetical protein